MLCAAVIGGRHPLRSRMCNVQNRRPLIREEQAEARVTPLELFFDLAFVFALTQVTAFMADELSWQGICAVR